MSETLVRRSWIYEIKENQSESILVKPGIKSLPDNFFDQWAEDIEKIASKMNDFGLQKDLTSVLKKENIKKCINSDFFEKCETKLEVLSKQGLFDDESDFEVFGPGHQIRNNFGIFSLQCEVDIFDKLVLSGEDKVSINAINVDSYSSFSPGKKICKKVVLTWFVNIYEEGLIEITSPFFTDVINVVSPVFSEA